MMPVRRAVPADSQALCALLLSDDPDSRRLVEYDRRPDFFALYRHLDAGPQNYWIAENAGCLAAFETKVNWNGDARLTYVTDAFVKSGERGGKTLLAVTRAFAEEFLSRAEPKYFYALEENPGGLEPLAEIAGRGDLWIKFIGTSTLYEINLSATSPVDEKNLTLQKYLRDADDQFLETYIKNYAATSGNLSPAVNKQSLRSLITLDPQAYFLIKQNGGQLHAALLAADLGDVRKMRHTPQALHILTMDPNSRAGRGEIKYQQWSMPWHCAGHEKQFSELLQFAAAHAQSEKFAFAGIRDLAEDPPASLNFRKYSHRILMGANGKTAKPDFTGKKFRLDPLFL